MGRYSYPTRAFVNLNAQNKAPRLIDDIDEEMKTTALSSGYEWSEDKKLNDRLHQAVSVKIVIDELPNGQEVNHWLAVMPDKKQYRGNLYGVDKELVPARTLTSEEIKKAVFGRMIDPSKDGDQFIRDEKYVDGERLLVKRMYMCTDPSLVATK